MKVLFSLTYYHPYISGLTICAGRIAEGLVKLGHQGTVIAYQHDSRLPETQKISDVQVERVTPLVKFHKGFLSFSWWSQSWKLVKENDSLVVNLPQMEGWIPSIFAKLLNKRLIAIYHCEVNLGGDFISQVIQVFLEIANTITLLLADVVVTYTQDYADHSRLLKYVKDKVVTHYPPVEVPKIALKAKKKLDSRLHGNDKKNSEKVRTVIVGVAARLAREKGVEYLLEAMPLIESKVAPLRHPSVKVPRGFAGRLRPLVAIAGPLDPVGELAYKVKIMQLVEKYKDQVVFLGSLSQKEMGAFYSLLDVLVLPSINSTEAFGLVQVEAMLTGVPVVASNLPGVRVPIQVTGMGKIVPVADSQALAQAIIEIVNNKSKFIKSKKMIAQQFSLENSIKFYDSLL